MSESSHWFDRLMTPRTRRQALTELLGAAAVVTLPTALLARSPARSEPEDGSNLCQRGCLYYYGSTNYDNEYDSCVNHDSAKAGVQFALRLYTLAGASALAALLTTPHAVAIDALTNTTAASCRDQALLNAKAKSFDCLQPNCSGFNPKGEGGPCATCKASCCADPGVVNGYSCCNLCSSHGGCCYSVTGSC